MPTSSLSHDHYDQDLLASAPEETRAQLMDQGDVWNPSGHDTSGAGKSAPQARRTSLSHDTDLEANVSREKAPPKRSFLSTAKGKITMTIVAIVIIAIVGGAVGGTVGKKKTSNNTTAVPPSSSGGQGFGPLSSSAAGLSIDGVSPSSSSQLESSSVSTASQSVSPVGIPVSTFTVTGSVGAGGGGGVSSSSPTLSTRGSGGVGGATFVANPLTTNSPVDSNRRR
ncbi:hypothetical protein FIBSPDRAFT_940661 [Athelia psychrophila]|uniref:Uncharacterized protein n=1 Tax=Athelia psychrophila TaxID=1759441 RepID=A0A167VJU3_9AGAM|nr:hypothetical protein FIBSPDRAFT_940661 [Fibularhizoctonia sp. CBS 109695]